MIFGVRIDRRGIDYHEIRLFTKSAERYGFHSVWFDDHLGLESRDYLECFQTLGAIAAETETIRIGTMVACNEFRTPGLLAKMVCTLDHISGGRVEFGIGIGWSKEEFESYGMPVLPYETRVGRLRESLTIMQKLWTGERTSFEGAFFEVKNAICSPKPLQEPHPPVWIGGAGRPLLRLVASFGTAWNYPGKLERYPPESAYLDNQLEKFGAPRSMIPRSINGVVLTGKDVDDLKMAMKSYRSKLGLVRNVSLSRLAQVIRNFSLLEDYGRHLLRIGTVENLIAGTQQQCIESIKGLERLGISHLLLDFSAVGLKGMEFFSQEIMPEFA